MSREQQKIFRIIKPSLIVLVGFCIFGLFFFLFNAKAGTGTVTPDPLFNANFLISDIDFINTGSMTPNEIQAFLESKGSVLATISPSKLCRECIYNSKGDCTKIEFCKNNTKSAAQLIYEAAVVEDSRGNPIGVNPAVLLVTLQKEQSLITSTTTTQTALDWAMGYGAYENRDWASEYAGFNKQVMYASKMLRYNYNPNIYCRNGGRGPNGYCLGDSFSLTNTTSYYNVPSSQVVKPVNKATMPLYRYTPHVFDGNYNFWYYWNYWFASPYKIKVYYQPTINATSFVEGNVVRFYFAVINKNKIEIKLSRLKVSIYGHNNTPQEIIGVSNVTIPSYVKFIFKRRTTSPVTVNSSILNSPGKYRTKVVYKHSGKWYPLSRTKYYWITVRPIVSSAFYLNPRLSITDRSIFAGGTTGARFTIYNNTHAPIILERLKVIFWNKDNAYDLAYSTPTTLNEKIDFSKNITISKRGVYKARILAKVNGKWIIPSGNVDDYVVVR